ncbi:MAG TPA: zinc-ribbon domain-containing protein [Deltaproteobacteria bacterium]|nr:iron-sulfur cluster assembly scaffold protein [Deltaproteobacteria bacterium]MBW2111293.1 iron-sulfur cluster assembly scaffold protein [Deltaproteobacteria bacterium]MBW2353764.1 iron-sulfur cluster assembly scaffold protein [Deltaproteobacteria bacterium]HDH98915.1 zinc-ribbon domain-containing protein [Deltaproteobacteria bacterium]
MYSEQVMDHFSDPRNVGTIEDADGIGEVGNPVCGDMMTFYIRVEDEKIADVKYKTFGCVAAIAVSSKVSEMTKGKSLKEAKALTKQAVAAALDGLPKEKMHCSNLGAQALNKAIEDYEDRKSGRPVPVTRTISKETPKVDIQCSKCHTTNPIVAKFCMNCGEGLGEEKDG